MFYNICVPQERNLYVYAMVAKHLAIDGSTSYFLHKRKPVPESDDRRAGRIPLEEPHIVRNRL